MSSKGRKDSGIDDVFCWEFYQRKREAGKLAFLRRGGGGSCLVSDNCCLKKERRMGFLEMGKGKGQWGACSGQRAGDKFEVGYQMLRGGEKTAGGKDHPKNRKPSLGGARERCP